MIPQLNVSQALAQYLPDSDPSGNTAELNHSDISRAAYSRKSLPFPIPPAISRIARAIGIIEEFDRRLEQPYPGSDPQRTACAAVGTAASVGTGLAVSRYLPLPQRVQWVVQPAIARLSAFAGDTAQDNCHTVANVITASSLMSSAIHNQFSSFATPAAPSVSTIASSGPASLSPAALLSTPAPQSVDRPHTTTPRTALETSDSSTISSHATVLITGSSTSVRATANSSAQDGAAPSTPLRLLPPPARAVIQREAAKETTTEAETRSVNIPRPTTLPTPTVSFEEVAERMISIAGNMTGVMPALSQANQLKSLYTNIMANPDDAPEMLLNQFFQGPREIFQRMVDTPREAFNRLLSDPSISSAAGMVAAALATVSLVNEIFPILHAATKDINRGNILKIPLTITKEMMKLTFNKILAVDRLAKDFIDNPLRAGFNLVKGLAEAPVVLFKNVCKLFSGDDDDEDRLLDLEIEIINRQTMEKRNIRLAVATCYSLSGSLWIRRPDESIDRYFEKLVEDWKLGVEQQRIQVGFLIFANQIKAHLETGNLLEAYQLSPQAHVRDLIPPQTLVHVFHALAQSGVKTQIEVISLDAAIKIYDESQNEIVFAANEMLAASETLKASSSKVTLEHDNVKSANESFHTALSGLKTESERLAAMNESLSKLTNNQGALQALRNRIQISQQVSITAR